jgi:hypothetical protein
MFGNLCFFPLDQMNVTLALFWFEHFVHQRFCGYLSVLMILVFVVAQSVAIPYFYFVSLKGGANVIGWAANMRLWMKKLVRPARASSNRTSCGTDFSSKWDAICSIRY